jgi:hypothetical protein
VASSIKEVYHPEWLANPTLVLKNNNNEWRMCVQYTYLNKHCLKDPFMLPHFDQVNDSMAGCVLLSFLDCYSGYHQIALKEEDQNNKAFITPFGAYPYKTMSFGLKYAGATYVTPDLQGHKSSNRICAKIKSRIYTTELSRYHNTYHEIKAYKL